MVLRRIVDTAAICLLPMCISAQILKADTVRIPARVNQNITVGSSTFQFSDFGGQNVPIMPVAGDGGHIAFLAFIRGSGVTSSNSQTLWRADRQGNLLLLARPGLSAPTQEAGVLISGSGSPNMNHMGDVAFNSGLSGPGIGSGVNNLAWIAYREGAGFQVLARQGEDLSALGLSANLGAIESAVFLGRDPRRTLILKGSLVGGSAAPGDKAIISSRDALSLVVRKSDAAPGMSGVQFADPLYNTNDGGQAVVFSYLFGPGVRARGSTSGAVPTDQAIWKVPPNPAGSSSLVKVVRAGDPAPGLPGQYFETLFSTAVQPSILPRVNTDGNIAFSARLATVDGTIGGTGIWSTLSGTLAPVAVSGTAAPGAGSGVTYFSLFSPFGFQHVFACDANQNVAGSEDSVVFAARLGGTGVNSTNDRAIFRHENGETQMLMRGGFEVSGADPGTTIVNSTLGDTIRVNRYGVIAANVQLAGPSVTAATDRAIISTLSGAARIVAREGQAIPNTDGFVISEIRSSAALWSNALGQIVFTANAVHPSAPTDVRDAILRIDQEGELRAISVSGEIITGQQGPTIRNGPIYYSTSAALADNGTFVYIGDLSAGGDVTGRSVVAVDITPASSTPLCPADFNSDGSATVQDIFDFLSLWFAQDTAADFNNDQAVTVQDLFDFLDVWFGGCS